MTNLLDGPIRDIVGEVLPGLVAYEMTLVRKIQGDIDPDTNMAPTPTTVTFACQGYVEEFTSYEMANSLIQANAVKLAILPTTLGTDPDHGDKVTPLAGPYKDRTFVVHQDKEGGVRIVKDAAGALWTMQGLS